MLLPKPFRKQKLTIWKNFTILDFVIFIAIIGTGMAIAFSIKINLIFSIIILIIWIVSFLPLLIFSKTHNCKLYILIIRKLFFLIKHKKFINKDSDKENKQPNSKFMVPFQNFKNIDSIGILTTKVLKANEVSYVGALNLIGIDISTLESDEKIALFNQFQQVIKVIDHKISILKTSKNYNFEKNYQYFEANHNKISEERIDLFNSYKQNLSDLSNIFLQENYNVIVYGVSEQDLLANIQKIKELFHLFNPKTLNINQLVSLQRDVFCPLDDNQIDLSSFTEIEIDTLINFESLEFKSKYFIIEKEIFTNIQSISEYPISIDYQWMSTLFQTPSSVLVHIEPVPIDVAKSEIHKTLNKQLINEMESNHVNAVSQKEKENTMEAMEQMVEKIASGEEKLKRMQLFFISSTSTQDELKEINQMNTENCELLNILINPLIFQQLEAFQNCYFKPTNNINLEQEIPDETLAGSWPFNSKDLNEGNLNIVGQTSSGNVFIFDQFLKNESSRKNFNMFLLGTSGSGKSTFTKKLLSYHLSENRIVIVIDPEREYKDLTSKLKGSWIEVGGESNTILNPLEISQTLLEKEVEKKQEKDQIINEHINFVSSWFQILYYDLVPRDIRLLEKALKHLYLNTKSLLNDFNLFEDFPIISDLIILLEEEIINFNYFDKSWIENIKNLLEIISHDFKSGGKYFSTFNGISNININDDFTVFDVQKLYNGETSNQIQAILFLILSMIQSKIVLNYREEDLSKQKELILCVDEAHLLINDENHAALNFLSKTMKRIRKYRGSVILTTQNPKDFMTTKETASKSSALVGNSQYSIFMNLKSDDVDSVDELFKNLGGLTKNEKTFLMSANKGEALFMLDQRTRFKIRFNYSNFEKNLFFDNWKKEYETNESNLINFESKNKKEKNKKINFNKKKGENNNEK